MSKYILIQFKNKEIHWYLQIDNEKDLIELFNTKIKEEFDKAIEHILDHKEIYYLTNGVLGVQSGGHITDHISNALLSILRIKVMYDPNYDCNSYKDFLSVMSEEISSHMRGVKKHLELNKKVYISNNYITYTTETPDQTILAEKEVERSLGNLVVNFPEKNEYNEKDIRILKWRDGIHYYAKVGCYDVVDKCGNQKFNNKRDAEEASNIFLIELNKELQEKLCIN